MTSTSKRVVRLPYTPPYDWSVVLGYFRNHQIPFLEDVDESGYERVISTRSGLGWIRVEVEPDKDRLKLTLRNGDDTDLALASKNVRRMFDLDADPVALSRTMDQEASLAELWSRYPGLRLARSWDVAEALFGAILGQVVSVSFGRVLMSELMLEAGNKTLHPRTAEPVALFPTAKQILHADLSGVRTSSTRRRTMTAVAEAIDDGTLSLNRSQDRVALQKTLLKIPGIGTWTAEYVALRGFGDDDAFPKTDYALKQVIRNMPRTDFANIRPRRGYAAVLLWRYFAEQKTEHTTDEL